MKGLFIPDITTEMFRNGCLEGIEALMAEGELYDIEYNPKQRWIPCSERLPEPETEVLVSFDNGSVEKLWQKWADPLSVNDGNYPGEPLAYIGRDEFPETDEDWARLKTYVIAWMPLPEPYKAERRTDDCV